MSSIQKNTSSPENTATERTYDTFATETCYSPLPSRFDRLAHAPIDGPTKKNVKKCDSVGGDGLAGERVDPGDVYFNKQIPTNDNEPKMIKSSSTLERRYWFDRETGRYVIQ